MSSTFLCQRKGNALLSVPRFSAAFGTRNWAAILYEDRNTRYKVGRIFLKRAKEGIYDIGHLEVGDYLEFACDEGERKDRWLGKAVSMSEDNVLLEEVNGYERLFGG